jgi:hypothetical protein
VIVLRGDQSDEWITDAAEYAGRGMMGTKGHAEGEFGDANAMWNEQVLCPDHSTSHAEREWKEEEKIDVGCEM